MYCNYILQLCSKLLLGHWPYSVYSYICTWPLAINFADMPINILSLSFCVSLPWFDPQSVARIASSYDFTRTISLSLYLWNLTTIGRCLRALLLPNLCARPITIVVASSCSLVEITGFYKLFTVFNLLAIDWRWVLLGCRKIWGYPS